MDPLGHAHRFKAKLLHAYFNESTTLDYWKMMMREDLLASIVYATNQQQEMRHHPLTYNKLQYFLGIILAMALAPKGDRQDLWNVENQRPIPAMNFRRFMARDEFENNPAEPTTFNVWKRRSSAGSLDSISTSN